MTYKQLTYCQLKTITSIIGLGKKIMPIFLFSLLFISILTPKKSISQDLHYSQFLNSPLNLNPALTAYSQANYRLILNNRNQWASVTVPYKTFSGSFDFKFLNRKKSRDYFGLGIIFNKDEAGDSHYGTTQIGLSLSWVKSLSRKNHHILSLGVQSSYFQRSIDYSQLYFPEQWNGNTSVIGSHSEIFTTDRFTFIDFAAGVHYLYTPNRNFKLNTGISAWHITRPEQNLMSINTSANDPLVNSSDYNKARLNIKTQIYTEAEIATNTRFDILPSVYVSLQGPYKEIVIGSRFYYKIQKTRHRFMALSTGIYSRNKDALILFAGMDYKNARLGISYDINLSPLKVASQYQGGMEISLKWLIFKSTKVPKIESTPCPIF